MRHRIETFPSLIRRAAAAPRLLIVAGAATLALSALVAAAAPGQAATAVGIDTLNSGVVHLTYHGRTWDLQISAQTGLVPTSDITIDLSTSYKGGTELHSWNTSKMPAADFTVNESKGTASVSTGKFLGSLGTVTLTYKPTSHKKESCNSGEQTNFSGSLSGSISLNTGLKGVKFGKRTVHFAKPNTLEVDDECLTTPCNLIEWEAGSSSGTKAPIADEYLVGRPSHQSHLISVVKGVTVNSKIGLVREDVGFMKGSTPRFGSHDKSLTVKGSSSRLVTGSGVIKGTAHVSEPTQTCTKGSTKYTEKITVYRGAFHASKTFEAHTKLTGTIKVSTSGKGLYFVVKLKKK